MAPLLKTTTGSRDNYDLHMLDADPTGDLWRERVAHRVPMAKDASALGADPDAEALDDSQRSYAGQYRRRLRRIEEQRRHAVTDGDNH